MRVYLTLAAIAFGSGLAAGLAFYILSGGNTP